MKAYWLDTGQTVTLDEIKSTNVGYEKLDTSSDYQENLDRIKEAQGYLAQDIVELKPDTPDLDTIIAKYEKEHLHTDDEVRFVLQGAGIFDIRSNDNKWIRVEVSEGDYLSVPANRYHRFFLTDEKSIQCVRLFKDESGWAAHYRNTVK